jgi:sensor histidine kinase YesM
VSNPYDTQAPARRGARGGVGLANVSRRLSACYRGASLTTHRETDRFTSTVVLPVRLEETSHGDPVPRLAQGADRR